MEAGDGTARARSHLSLSWNIERETQHGSHEEGSSKPCLVFTGESKDVRARRKLGYTATTGGSWVSPRQFCLRLRTSGRKETLETVERFAQTKPFMPHLPWEWPVCLSPSPPQNRSRYSSHRRLQWGSLWACGWPGR